MGKPPPITPARGIPLAFDDYRRLVESVADYAIFMLDLTGHVASWHLGAERINGYRADEIIGEHFSKFYPPEDIAAGKPERELVVAAEQGRVEDEGWRLRKDGSRFWASVVITAVRDEDGNLRGFAKVTRDRTQQRLASERIHAAEQRFHHLVDAVTDYAIFMLDLTGRVATWNVGAEKIKGYLASEIIGRHFSAFYTAEDRAAGKPEQILERVRADGRYEDESWRVRKDGSRFLANVVITSLRDTDGKLIGFAKVTRDLTAQRHAEEMQRSLLVEQAARGVAEQTATRASEANRIKDEFLATVSHELRTPLNAIVGWTAVLRRRQLEAEVSKAIDAIDRNARAQVKIVDDILDISRIISGKLRIEQRPIDLVAITGDAIDVVRPSAAAKQIEIQFRAEPGTPLLVGDPDRLQQVIWNLLANAVKFTDPKGLIQVAIEQAQSQLVLSVSDTGRGIDPEFLPFVFDRFKQADASTTRRFGGLGLGLAIVRDLVEMHGGTVAVDSQGLGLGSTFRIALPVRAVQLVERDSVAAVKTPDPALPRPGVLSALRVLVVDDDPDAREIIAMVLSDAGAVVRTASSAAEGMAALREDGSQVLVSDIAMPGEDGFSFIRRVRSLEPRSGGAIPAIALTAYTRNEDRTKVLAAGFTTHIGKPVEPSDLVAAVANLALLSRR